MSNDNLFDSAMGDLDNGAAGGDNSAWKATAGIHGATCVGIVDLGMVESEWNGQKKIQRKIQLCFALNDQSNEGEAVTILSKRYTASMHEKSAFAKDLTLWGQHKVAKLGDLVGKQATLIVKIDDEKGYVDIGAISAPMKGQAEVTDKCYLPKFWFVTKDGAETGYKSIAHPTLVIPGIRPKKDNSEG